MKLLLAFAIISFLAQTTQGSWESRRCWNDIGRCRRICRSNEKNHSQCTNKQKCCSNSFVKSGLKSSSPKSVIIAIPSNLN
uniref:Beta-defensin n=1 Tax=Monodelphis domestica TaxID=13616 RepID=A0A5F8HD94_MONDO